MEILNILYNNSNIAFYLIGAILVVIFIFIIITSMYTTPKTKKEKEEILNDPTEDNYKEPEVNIIEIDPNIKETSKINDMVEDLYQKSLDTEEKPKETQDLNTFLQEFDVPTNVINEVVKDEKENQVFNNINEDTIEMPAIKAEEKIDENIIKENKTELNTMQKTENIENMLKKLYDLRQNENEERKNALLNEMYELKKQVDETLKNNYNFRLNSNVDTKALADYYLFNEEIEFPKLK